MTTAKLIRWTTCAAVIVTLALTWCLAEGGEAGPDDSDLTYPIVDTMQKYVFSDRGQLTRAPGPGQPFYGQDAQFTTNPARYRDNRDGTIDDLVTGLTWLKKPYTGKKLTFAQATDGADRCRVGGHRDWRLPSIKELYSLIDFNGDVRATTPVPYIDTEYFEFTYGSGKGGERQIDAQYWSSTQYVGTTMNGAATVFGVNFADGRIKGYPTDAPPGPGAEAKTYYARFVRGNTDYGTNDFTDNGDGTITDAATGLTWTQADSGTGLNWQQALAWAQTKNAENHLGYNDWRVPNAKELQSIVDYTRSPDTTNSAAIDPVFTCTQITSEDGSPDYPFYWTSTTHIDGAYDNRFNSAVYVSFGRGLGWMKFPPTFEYALVDVHGAGCQRSDPKSGDPADYPYGFGPQGDVRRIYNHVRLVRGPFAQADFNEDGHVDTVDLETFTLCVTGPGVSYVPNLPAECDLTPDGDSRIAADFDQDGDADQADFGSLQRCLSGSETPADTECS